ncbi:MAG: hypothetical protein DSY38_02005, partial [Fusobacteria bacterium]
MFYKKENGWKNIEESRKKEIMDFSEGYKKFLDDAKTEREVITVSQQMAEANGFVYLITEVTKYSFFNSF